jgi:hypothetical protein
VKESLGMTEAPSESASTADTQTLVEVGSVGYAAVATQYWDLGWGGVLPLGRGTKHPPPKGFTGHNGIDPSYADICAWGEQHPDGNVALRPPDDIIGIDVDAYDGKTGGQTLAEAERLWGKLPVTYWSTSRTDGISGIRFFRVPPGTRLRDGIAFPELKLGGVDIIQHIHRYAMVWPSIHPNGRQYRWIAEIDGSVTDYAPAPGDVPDLPDMWAENLKIQPAHSGTGLGADGDYNVNLALTEGKPSPKVAQRLSEALSDLADVGCRHDDTRNHTLAMLRLGKDSEPGVKWALTKLGNVFTATVTADGSRTADEAASEFRRMIRNFRTGELLAEPSWSADTILDEFTGPRADEVVDFWKARPSLRRIHQFAQARMVGPWAVLIAALVRTMLAVSPEVRLPAIVGTPMSLNMSGALVGVSGGGKDGASGCARDAVVFGEYLSEPVELPLGSGEGMVRALMPDKDGKAAPVLFSASEIDTVTALFGRQGATLEPEIRKLYCGQQLGFTNAQKHTRTLVDAHTYRAGLIVCVQPLRAESLLKGADGGTPQRFVWAPVDDASAPDTPVELPKPWKLKIPPMFDPKSQVDGQWVDLDVPTAIRAEIRGHRLAVLRGEGVDPLDGHKLLCRLKVAAALMFLDSTDDNERKMINLDDWKLAGHIMAVSDRTREGVAAAGRAKASRENKARALAADEREAFGSERKLQRARAAITRRFDRAAGQSISRRDVRARLKSDIRDYFEPALAELIEEEVITEVAMGNGRGYTRSSGGPEVQRQ